MGSQSDIFQETCICKLFEVQSSLCLYKFIQLSIPNLDIQLSCFGYL